MTIQVQSCSASGKCCRNDGEVCSSGDDCCGDCDPESKVGNKAAHTLIQLMIPTPKLKFNNKKSFVCEAQDLCSSTIPFVHLMLNCLWCSEMCSQMPKPGG